MLHIPDYIKHAKFNMLHATCARQNEKVKLGRKTNKHLLTEFSNTTCYKLSTTCYILLPTCCLIHAT